MLNDRQLMEAAAEAANNAWAPYSGFRVGCAIRLEDNTVIRGCNVESASYGLTQCAERVAIGTAVANGSLRKDNRIKQVAIVCLDAEQPAPTHLVSSCGACRQVMSEHTAFDAQIKFHGIDQIFTINDLLPNAFRI